MRFLPALRPVERVLVIVSVLVALGCIRLGIWQLHRLGERRARNAIVASRLSDPITTIDALPRDSALQHFRRIAISGTFDYAHAVVLTGRTRNGSPGVNLVTPVHVPGHDTAVLVNRGWIYAPDGVAANVAPWREGDTVNSMGYVVPFATWHMGTAVLPGRTNAYRWIDSDVARRAFPYPVYPFFVVLQGDIKAAGGILPRVEPPPLDEGPHLGYAFQWFVFATIALTGAFFFVKRRGMQADDTVRPLI